MTSIGRNVAVIGAGTMGNGIAHVFALHGHPVTLIDSDPAALRKGMDAIARNLERQVSKNAITADDRDVALKRINAQEDLESAHAADLVVEAIVEDEEVKADVFRTLDAIVQPQGILSSNTSSISITRLGAVTSRPDQTIGMHFMNPVPVMKLVEVIRGYATSDDTHRTVVEMATALGKTPVTVRDYPGFVSNRVLMPMINEAIFCVMEGVAEPEAIDTVMKLGMAHPMGPLALSDLIGLDTLLAIGEVLREAFPGDPRYESPALLRDLVGAGKLGKKSGGGFYDG